MNWDEIYQQGIEILEERSVNVDVSHRCLLQCPFCSRQNVFGNDMVKESHSYGDLRYSDAIHLGNTFNTLSLCGQISDPIYHTNFIEIFKVFLTTSCKQIHIHTTGSHKKKTFWTELYEASSKTDKHIKFIFGIDGIDEKSSIHRVNQKAKQALDAMFMGVEYAKKHSNIEIAWQYIPFAYNEDDLETAMNMAKENNISFILLKSGRFRSAGNLLEPPKNKDLYNTKQFAERIEIK